MKNQVLLVLSLFFVFTTQNIKAQYLNTNSSSIELTPHLGYSSSTFGGENVDQLEYRSSLKLGIYADIYFNDKWSFRSGFTRLGMGTEVKNSSENIHLEYFNIPLQANWHFSRTRAWNLNFGLTPGFLLNGKINGQEVDDIFKPVQVSLAYGIGYKIKATETIGILLDYQGLVGLTDVFEENQNTLTWLNVASAYSVGVAIRLP